MIIYLAGPYRGQVTDNIERAVQIAGEVWAAGHVALCPHANTAHFDTLFPGIPDEAYLDGDMKLVARCDAMLMLPHWEESSGANGEKQYAESLGIPVYIYPDVPPLHVTEQRSPDQVKRFAEVVMTMYRVHLEKNADYSPANIGGTGEIGLTTRLWDKMCRLLNLQGFRQEVKLLGYEAPRSPKNESIEDTYIDLANYGIIGLLLREGKWGH